MNRKSKQKINIIIFIVIIIYVIFPGLIFLKNENTLDTIDLDHKETKIPVEIMNETENIQNQTSDPRSAQTLPYGTTTSQDPNTYFQIYLQSMWIHTEGSYFRISVSGNILHSNSDPNNAYDFENSSFNKISLFAFNGSKGLVRNSTGGTFFHTVFGAATLPLASFTDSMTITTSQYDGDITTVQRLYFYVESFSTFQPAYLIPSDYYSYDKPVYINEAFQLSLLYSNSNSSFKVYFNESSTTVGFYLTYDLEQDLTIKSDHIKTTDILVEIQQKGFNENTWKIVLDPSSIMYKSPEYKIRIRDQYGNILHEDLTWQYFSLEREIEISDRLVINNAEEVIKVKLYNNSILIDEGLIYPFHFLIFNVSHLDYYEIFDVYNNLLYNSTTNTTLIIYTPAYLRNVFINVYDLNRIYIDFHNFKYYINNERIGEDYFEGEVYEFYKLEVVDRFDVQIYRKYILTNRSNNFVDIECDYYHYVLQNRENDQAIQIVFKYNSILTYEYLPAQSISEIPLPDYSDGDLEYKVMDDENNTQLYPEGDIEWAKISNTTLSFGFYQEDIVDIVYDQTQQSWAYLIFFALLLATIFGYLLYRTKKSDIVKTKRENLYRIQNQNNKN